MLYVRAVRIINKHVVDVLSNLSLFHELTIGWLRKEHNLSALNLLSTSSCIGWITISPAASRLNCIFRNKGYFSTVDDFCIRLVPNVCFAKYCNGHPCLPSKLLINLSSSSRVSLEQIILAPWSKHSTYVLILSSRSTLNIFLLLFFPSIRRLVSRWFLNFLLPLLKWLLCVLR